MTARLFAAGRSGKKLVSDERRFENPAWGKIPMMQRDDWQSAFSALLIGVGIGATLGVLLAPSSGEETRDSLLRSLKRGHKAAHKKGEKLVRCAKDTVAEAIDQAGEIVESVERTFTKASGA